jgi:hypothetical protein
MIRTHLAARVQRRSRNIFDRGIGKEPGRRVGLPVKLLKDGPGWRLLRRERELQVVDDPVDDGVFREEGDDGQDRPEHVLTHALGLRFCLGPGQAVDIEAGVRPGKNATENGDGRED